MRSRISFVIGLLLAVGAFVALFVVGQMINPSPYHVVVVVKEVSPGTALSFDMVGVDSQSLDPRVAREYVLQDELDEWLGSMIIEPLHPGEPLMHAHLVRAENPAAARRLALGLEDSDLVAMVIPVDSENAPQNIRARDRVDVIYGVGDVGTGGAMESYQSAFPTPLSVSGTEEVEATRPAWGATPEPSPTPRMTFPMAKVCVRSLTVLDVIHDEKPNPAYGGPESGEAPTIPGEVIAIQVAVPREQEEILHYVVTTGKYQIALLSPNAVDENDPTLGMTWDDLQAFFWAERERALESITDTTYLLGPGAAAILSTPQSTPIPRSTPVISLTSAPTATLVTPMPAATPVPTSAPEEPVNETPSPTPTASASSLGGGLSSSLIFGVVCAGGGLVLVLVIGFAVVNFLRRRKAAGSGSGRP